MAKPPSIIATEAPAEIPRTAKAFAPKDKRFNIRLYHPHEREPYYLYSEIKNNLSLKELARFKKQFGVVDSVYPLDYIRFIRDLEYEEFVDPRNS